MKWSIEFSKDADSFLDKNRNIEKMLLAEIKKIVLKLKGETVNINFKKLSAPWKGYYRIRKGKIRIIVFLDFVNNIVYIDTIDFRGNAYR